MLSGLRYFLADLRHWLWTHKVIVLLVVILIAGGGIAAYLVASAEDEEPAQIADAPAPQVIVEVEAPEETEDLGFPAFATKNTTRVAGVDPIADAAGVALAVDPSTGGVPGPGAVTLVDAEDWAGGIAAASLVAEPVGAPILLSDGDELPELTASAIRALAPAGAPETDGRQVFAVGDAARPAGFDSVELEGANAAELAARIARLRERLAGKPAQIVIASSDDPEIAMPAAGWAARSGDPVLFVNGSSLPAATAEVLAEHEDTPVYALGPESSIPAAVVKEIEEIGPKVERVGAEDPVENAIEFARYSNEGFGWNINDPGHGFVIASVERPLDAAVASPLSASGTWGPLLLTDDAATIPDPLRGYLLDLKPGYEDDPTRALYNHIWLIGDPEAISVDFQAQVDELAEVTQVRSGSGDTALGPAPGTPESQPDPDRDNDDEKKP